MARNALLEVAGHRRTMTGQAFEMKWRLRARVLAMLDLRGAFRCGENTLDGGSWQPAADQSA
jgi:hypothetical protein